MTLLSRELTDVTMSDSSVASPNYVRTQLKPFRMPYENERIVRYVARYAVGLAYVAVT